MEKSLLELLNHSEIRSTLQLAQELGTSVEMVEARLERYEQLGYVKRTVMNSAEECGGNCKKCRGCSGMKTSQPAVVFWEKC